MLAHSDSEFEIGELSKTLECGICLNVVCNPKQLACDHSYCRSCLDKILVFQPNGSATIKCPSGCTKETSIQSNQTTNDLGINFMLKSVLDLATKHQPSVSKEKCASCPRTPVKYCDKCSLFKCGECVDDHEAEAFIPVDFNAKDPEGVIMCIEHKSEATHLCCELQYICTYCTHRGNHIKHVYTALQQAEQSTRDLIQQMVEMNDNYDKRQEEVKHQVHVEELKLDAELRSRKWKRLLDYKMFLDGEESKIRDKFQQIQSSFLSAFESISYFKENVGKESFPFLLERTNIAKKLKTVYMDSPNPIPGITVSLIEGNDNCPLGSLETVYCNEGSCKNFSGKFNDNDNDIDIPTLKLLRGDLSSFLKLKQKEDVNEFGERPAKRQHTEEKNDLNEEGESDEKQGKDENQNVLDIVGDGDLLEEKAKVVDHQCKPKEIFSFPVTKVTSTITCAFQLRNISKAYGDAFSDPVVMGSHIFKVNLKQSYKTVGTEKVKYAGFFLWCFYQGFKSTWTCQVDVKMTLKMKKNLANDTRSFSKLYDENSEGFGWRQYVKWCDILDPSKVLIVNDTINLDVVITKTSIS